LLHFGELTLELRDKRCTRLQLTDFMGQPRPFRFKAGRFCRHFRSTVAGVVGG
jgi:hypothetical protein